MNTSVIFNQSSRIPGGPLGYYTNADVPNLVSGAPFDLGIGLGNIEPPAQVERTQSDYNRFVQYAYPLIPWGDGKEERIMEWQVVFASKYIDKKVGKMTGMVTIGQLNVIMRDAHNLFEDYAQTPNSTEANFKAWLKDTPDHEEQLDHYEYLRNKNLQSEMVDNNIAEMYQLATKDIFCYQTKFGIKKRWTYLGVVLSKQGATTLMSTDRTQYGKHTNVANVILDGKARVANIWGSRKHTRAGAQLFLVLNRAKRRNQEYAQYQVVPYSTILRSIVPISVSKNAHVWHVGRVLGHESSKAPSEAQRFEALGLYTREQAAYEAAGTLPFMSVCLGNK